METKGTIFNYPYFIQWMDELVRNRRTSGPTQSESLLNFTALNLKRMQRIYKTTTISDDLQQALSDIESKQTWLVITEAWCGDSAQSLPILGKIAAESGGKVELSIMLRDENPEWIEKYRTNGSKSIPKLIIFDQSGSDDLFTWGPRPAQAQQLLLDWKISPNGRTWDDFEKELHTWYAHDKGVSIQQELNMILTTTVAEQV